MSWFAENFRKETGSPSPSGNLEFTQEMAERYGGGRAFVVIIACMIAASALQVAKLCIIPALLISAGVLIFNPIHGVSDAIWSLACGPFVMLIFAIPGTILGTLAKWSIWHNDLMNYRPPAPEDAKVEAPTTPEKCKETHPEEPPSMIQTYIWRDNQQQGPFDDEQIQQLLKSGGVNCDDWASREGMVDWVPLSTLLSDDEEVLVQKCIEIMRQERRASTSLFQRRLRLGYSRTARIMDILERRCYIAPGKGAGPREILGAISKPLDQDELAPLEEQPFLSTSDAAFQSTTSRNGPRASGARKSSGCLSFLIVSGILIMGFVWFQHQREVKNETLHAEQMRRKQAAERQEEEQVLSVLQERFSKMTFTPTITLSDKLRQMGVQIGFAGEKLNKLRRLQQAKDWKGLYKAVIGRDYPKTVKEAEKAMSDITWTDLWKDLFIVAENVPAAEMNDRRLPLAYIEFMSDDSAFMTGDTMPPTLPMPIYLEQLGEWQSHPDEKALIQKSPFSEDNVLLFYASTEDLTCFYDHPSYKEFNAIEKVFYSTLKTLATKQSLGEITATEFRQGVLAARRTARDDVSAFRKRY